MSLNLNNVTLAGNLTRDPQVRFFANEKCVADFGLAINRRFKDAQGQQKEEVTYVDIEAWGRTAELAGQYLVKGKAIYLEGRLKFDSWDDKESGKKRSKLKVVADVIQFLSPRVAGDGPATSAGDAAPVAGDAAPARPAAAPAGGAVDDEPPF